MYKTKEMNLNISAGLMVVHFYLFLAAMFLSASLFVLAHNVLIESALKSA